MLMGTMMNRLERVIKVIVDNLNISTSINTEHNLVDDLGADSLDTVEIVMMIEEEFDVVIPDDDSFAFETVGDIANWLNGALGPEE
jgi:acyl carrier protein